MGAGAPWTQSCIYLASWPDTSALLALALEREASPPHLPATPQGTPHHSGGPESLIFQPVRRGAEFARDLLPLFLSGHFLVLRLVELVLVKDTNAVSFGARIGAHAPKGKVRGRECCCCPRPANLGLKDECFQAVGSFLPFLLL